MPIMVDADIVLNFRKAAEKMISSSQNFLGAADEIPFVRFEFRTHEARDQFVRSVIQISRPA